RHVPLPELLRRVLRMEDRLPRVFAEPLPHGGSSLAASPSSRTSPGAAKRAGMRVKDLLVIGACDQMRRLASRSVSRKHHTPRVGPLPTKPAIVAYGSSRWLATSLSFGGRQTSQMKRVALLRILAITIALHFQRS